MAGRRKNPRHELNYSIQEALKPVTVGDAISYWLEMHVKENRVDYVSLKSRLNNHVIQHIGNMPLDKCELRHWLACFDRMPGRTDPMKPHITEKDGALWYVEPIPNTRAEELNHKETWLSDRMRTAGNAWLAIRMLRCELCYVASDCPDEQDTWSEAGLNALAEWEKSGHQ